MSTKNNPGAFRCYEAALPDEHVFTILARDPAGPATLRFWATEREKLGKTENPDDRDRIEDARRDALLMEDWREKNLDPLGDGSGPSWKLTKINDEEGGPIRVKPDNVQYVPAERDGDEAVRLNVEWLTARTRDLVEGRMTREEYTRLIELACQSPDRRRPPVAEPIRGEYVDDETGVVKTTTLQTSRDVTEIDTPDMPPHRFAMFDKGKGWAYGRGLEINPAHIPAMLDRMEEDGYTLVAALGAQADKVGMIFQRGPRYSGLELAHGFGAPAEVYHPRDGGRATEKSDRFLAGEPLDQIAGDPPVAENLYEPFVIEYATRDSDGNCVIHRTPFDHWPLWAQPCGDRGRGQMP